MVNFARIYLVAIDVTAELAFNCSRTASHVEETVSSQHSSVGGRFICLLSFSSFTDTDENAFEARDLESDFHDDVSTTKNPTTSSHGIYKKTYSITKSNEKLNYYEVMGAIKCSSVFNRHRERGG